MKLAIIILMIFVLICVLIISNNNLALADSENFERFGEIWVDWMNKIFDNFKSLSGNVVNMDWGP